jgi:hypothetical protein
MALLASVLAFSATGSALIRTFLSDALTPALPANHAEEFGFASWQALPRRVHRTPGSLSRLPNLSDVGGTLGGYTDYLAAGVVSVVFQRLRQPRSNAGS